MEISAAQEILNIALSAFIEEHSIIDCRLTAY
jgi:hypothetical protein